VSNIEPEILSRVAAYYTSKLAAHGSTPQGVDWNGTESHERRHRQFLRLLDGNPNASVLDFAAASATSCVFSAPGAISAVSSVTTSHRP
jgi:hypothetical protein